MEESMQYLDIRQLKALFPGESVAGLGDDFFIADFRYGRALKMFRYPCRFDGYIAIFCLKGHFSLDLNLDTFDIKENSLVFSVPGNIIRVSHMEYSALDKFRFMMIAVSKDFMTGLRLDFNHLFNESMIVMNNPCITLEGDGLRVGAKYLDLAADLLTSDIPNKKDSVASLLSSVLYLLASIWRQKISDARQVVSSPSARSKVLMDQFLRLVTEHHNKERNVTFYARKLGLTPKYLSKFVKTVSGRSAPEWIDSFVILEAKNLLKYSGISVKQIVYKLNFSNQSIFYKFFKAHTGMTPCEYRNS